MEHSKGKLELVSVGGVAIGGGFKEDTGKTAIHCFRMIFNTITDKHQDYHTDKVNANACRLINCWNDHDTLKAKADLHDELVAALTAEYVADTPLFEYPPTTREKSYGGGDCSVHGRWYGICHCCRNASKKTSSRREQEVKWKKDAAVNDILAKCKEIKK